MGKKNSKEERNSEEFKKIEQRQSERKESPQQLRSCIDLE
jgi:hypothetical protein